MNKYQLDLLPRFSVERPVTVIMMLIALLVLGGIAYLRIPVDLLPAGLQGSSLSTWVPYPNASPIEVEEKIAKPLEEVIGTIRGVEKIYSNSSSGGNWLRIGFKSGTNMDVAYAQLRDRMDRVMPELPDEIERIDIRAWDENDIPIMWIGVNLEGKYSDPFFVLDSYVRPVLQRVEGVGNVEIGGSAGQQVEIEVDQEKANRHGIDLLTLVQRLQQENFTLSGGYVFEGGRKVYVRSLGRFDAIETIRNLPIDSDYGLTLGDIARVELERPKREAINRINKKDSMGMVIRGSADGNIVQISSDVQAALKELQRVPQLAGIDFEIFWDQGKAVNQSIDNLKNSGLWGGLFASLVLFLFLRAIRMTLIVTLAIPLSIMCTIIVLYFYGWSLNIVTMMGLMLSLGLVVDNAIVIVESIYRQRQMGISPRKAAIAGAGEVGLAITMATLTSVVVFLPLVLMSGETEFSFWMFRLGLPVMVGLVASLFIALVFIPLASERLHLSKGKEELRLILWVRQGYMRALQWVLSNRIDALIIFLLAMASIQYPMSHLERTNEQGGYRNDMRISFEMPSGQSLQAADVFMTAVEDTLLAHKERYNIRSLNTEFNRGSGEIQMIFQEKKNVEWYEVAWNNILIETGFRKKPHLNADEIAVDFKERVELPPGISLRLRQGSNSGQQDDQLTVNLYGQDTRILSELSKEVVRRLRRIPGLLSVYADTERGGYELQVRLNRDKARRYGVEPQAVSGSIAYSLRGLTLSRFQTEDGRELDIRMRSLEGEERSLQELRTLTFPAKDGKDIPLESIASLYVESTLGQIRREDRMTMLAVTAIAEQDNDETLFRQVDQAMQGFEMPRGYRWDKGDSYVRLQESDESQIFAMILSVMFIFLLMGVLFESFVLPLSVIVSIPFSFFGVYWMLYLTGTPQTVLSGIGSVILIGVVVNNAIVLIDLTNRLRATGIERFEALLEAGKHRFRPILMTTFTTACGLIPMAIGNSNMMGMPYAPLGRTMMGGLLASTVLTLVLVPLFYTFFDDMRIFVQQVMTSAVRTKESV